MFNDAVNCYDYIALVTDESLSGMILRVESRSTRRIICRSATLFIINPTCTGFGLNPSFFGDRPLTGLINDGALCSLEPRNHISANRTDRSCTYKSQSRPTAAFINHVIRNGFKNVIYKRRFIFLTLQKCRRPAFVTIHE